MPNAATDRQPLTDVAIDAHYYDKGLKVARLAGGALQPHWVPAGATDLVGLHEAFSMQPGDRAVEISRLRSGANAITWIAVYRRSEDAAYGDRGNYAGVGVWLLNQVVNGPTFLLGGLDALSRTLADSGMDEARRVAARVLAPDSLPRELAPMRAMPPGLSGWTFSQDLLPAKELYEVTVADGERVEWLPVAEHILRMTLLPGPTAAHARSLILVRPAANSRFGANTGLKPLPTGFAGELTRALPAALGDQQRDVAALARDYQAVTEQRDRLQHELETAQREQANKALRIKDLETQLDTIDPDGRFKAMGGTLARIDEQARANRLALEQVAEAVRRIELKTCQSGGIGAVNAVGTSPAGRSSGLPDPTNNPSSSGTNRFPAQRQPSAEHYEPSPRLVITPVRLAIGLVVTLVAIAIGYLIYSTRRPHPAPPANDLDISMLPSESQTANEAGLNNQSSGENPAWQGYPAGNRSQDYGVNRNSNYAP